jgi:single stranded DNA-binding protein (ssb)
VLNRVVLVGRLTKDPDLRQTTTGVSVATFTIAVKRMFANQTGEHEVDFIQVIVWRKAAENVARYVGKGSLVGIDGRMQTRSYDASDGSKRYVTEVIADSVQFLESKNNGQQTTAGQRTKTNDMNFASSGVVDISDEDLPF